MRFALALSVAVNLLLLTSIVAARIDPGRGELADDAAVRFVEPDAVPAALRDMAGAAELIAMLEGARLSRDDLKPLVLGWLEREYRSAHRPPASRYWEQDYSPGHDQLAAEHAVGSAVRAALIEIFGPAAAADPAFDAVFRPLGPAYAFLGSRAQLSLQQRQLELLADPPRRPSAAGASLLCRAEVALPAEARVPLPDVELGAAEDLEYRLRFSPLAAQLRDSGIARDEAEFRELFALLASLEQPLEPSEQAALRTRLRERIGTQRFDRFWSMRDPLYAAIGRHFAGRDLTDYQLMGAYSILNRSQERLLSLIGGGGDAASILAASRRVSDDETEALGRLLGAEAAGRLQAAISEISLRLSEGSAAGC